MNLPFTCQVFIDIIKNIPKEFIMKKFLSVLFALFLVACGRSDISGTWIQPVPNMPHMVQGFTLGANGVATSVNMATLQYDTWRTDGDSLIMTWRSIRNGQTI